MTTSTGALETEETARMDNTTAPVRMLADADADADADGVYGGCRSGSNPCMVSRSLSKHPKSNTR